MTGSFLQNGADDGLLINASTQCRTKSSSAGGHLLLLGCSATKRDEKGEWPALERYDGVNYRVIRKFLSENGWPAGLEIKILSAKYGLIDATIRIENYDERMTKQRSEELRARVKKYLFHLENTNPFM